ncbi:hypothetical protein HUW86_08620 (plasmid) [Fusobacterium sp. SB021]|uniref:hypothetical protein n=1 Tax=Fusobacterium sp. SB021 TaxID=2744227 RepID=UPI003CE69807
MILKKIINYYKTAWKQLKAELKKIDEETEKEMLEYEIRHEKFLKKDKTLVLTRKEIFLWQILPIIFKIFIFLLIICLAVIAGIYYLIAALVISWIVGSIFIKL